PPAARRTPAPGDEGDNGGPGARPEGGPQTVRPSAAGTPQHALGHPRRLGAVARLRNDLRRTLRRPATPAPPRPHHAHRPAAHAHRPDAEPVKTILFLLSP